MDTVWQAAAAIVRAPLTRRTWQDLKYGTFSALAGAIGWYITLGLLAIGVVLTVSILGGIVGLALITVTLRLARRIGGLHRRLLARFLGRQVAGPIPFVPGKGLLSRADRRLRDRPAWRAVGYTQLKLLLAAVQGWAVVIFGFGLVDTSYPVLWALFRNHSPSTHLHPMVAIYPLPLGTADVHINTWGGTLPVAIGGMVSVLIGTWMLRGANAVDATLIGRLLGARSMAERVSDLERTRAIAVEDTAAVLRQVERDLHDGAQMRLAALAMNLGMAQDKLASDDPEVRELLEAAQHNAADALAELRDLARGIHPPALDNGLPDALRTLAATCAIPAIVTVDLADRPAPAIETIAWFCANELIANALKHSYANEIQIKISSQRTSFLTLVITDDGVGGATDGRGSGLAGLAQRVSTVDGKLDVYSPEGGPTIVTVELPVRA